MLAMPVDGMALRRRMTQCAGRVTVRGIGVMGRDLRQKLDFRRFMEYVRTGKTKKEMRIRGKTPAKNKPYCQYGKHIA